MEVASDGFFLEVRDDGRGWTETLGAVGMEPRRRSGQGVANLRARLERIGGRVEIEGASGAGTVVRMRVPLALGELRIQARGEETS
jgi:signal transduction histidine kinase